MLTRKEFVRLMSAGIAFGTTPGMPAASPLAQLATSDSTLKQRPNVLIIMTDQHRSDYMTAAGNEIVPTPNIDRIAARGVRFSNAVCPYPVCAASRMSLLTAQYAHTTGVINNSDLLSWKSRTMAHHFSDTGYHTGVIGKNHFNDAHKHGFEYFLGFNDWFMYLGPKTQYYADEVANCCIIPELFESVCDDGVGLPELPAVWGKQRPWSGHVRHIGLESEFTDVDDEFDAFVARESCRFLERFGRDEHPFLLIASFLKPHTPFHPPHPWADSYPANQMTLPPVGNAGSYPRWIQNRIGHFQSLGPERLREHRAGYLGNLAYVDTCVGEVYQALERLGLVNNTIVIYTSDHGEMDGEHGLYQKFSLFDPSIKVPLIVSQPGRLPEGKTSDALVEYLGIWPTLSELTGASMPENIDAHSFAKFVRNPSMRGPEAIFAEYNLRSRSDCYMVRTQRYKYNYNYGDIGELYDLEADPGETANQINNPSLTRVRSQLHDRLTAWYDPEKNPYRGTDLPFKASGAKS